MDGAIQKAGPLGSARELSGARTSLLDLSGWAVARRSLKNRHILHLIVPIQNQVIIVHLEAPDQSILSEYWTDMIEECRGLIASSPFETQ
jgi:hypothetical protein